MGGVGGRGRGGGCDGGEDGMRVQVDVVRQHLNGRGGRG